MPSPHDHWCLRGPEEEACRAPGCGTPVLCGRLCGVHRQEKDNEQADLAYEVVREREQEDA